MNEGMVEMDGSFKTTLHVPHKRCRSNSPSTPLPTCIICDPIGEGDSKMEGSPMETVEEDMKAYCGLSSCCHVFHYDCVYVWLTQKSSTCPICRRSVEYIDKWILSKHARRSSSPHVTETIRVCIPTKVFEEKDWWTTSESTSVDSSDEDEIVCMYCRRGDREAELMLCSSEQCSSAAHYDCVQPRPLLCVPEGDWFCVSCQRRRRRAQQQSTRNNHRISSRQATSVMSVRDRNAMSEIQRHIPHNRNRTIIHNTAGAAMDENRRGTSEKERDPPLESALTTHVATTTAGPDVTRVEMRRRFLFDDMEQDEASEQLNTSSQSRGTEIRSHTTRRAGGPGTMVSVEGLTGVPKPLLPLQRPTSSPPAMNENAVAPCQRDTKESTLSRFFSSSKFSPQLSGNAPSETHNMKNASLHYEQLVEGLSDLNRRRSQNAVNQRYPPSTRTKISSGVVSLTVPYPVQPSTRGVLLKSNRDASSIHQPRASCESPRTADGPTSSTSSLQVMNSDVPLDRSQIRNEIIQTLRPTVLQGELSAGSAATLASSISGVLLSLAPAQRTKDRLLIICREKLSEYVRTKTIL